MKLIPTHNHNLIKNKRFSAINIDEKVFQPISTIPKSVQSSKLINGSYENKNNSSEVE